MQRLAVLFLVLTTVAAVPVKNEEEDKIVQDVLNHVRDEMMLPEALQSDAPSDASEAGSIDKRIDVMMDAAEEEAKRSFIKHLFRAGVSAIKGVAGLIGHTVHGAFHGVRHFVSHIGDTKVAGGSEQFA